jgi:hypothetical protein
LYCCDKIPKNSVYKEEIFILTYDFRGFSSLSLGHYFGPVAAQPIRERTVELHTEVLVEDLHLIEARKKGRGGKERGTLQCSISFKCMFPVT